jgi:hypothetical protein
MRWLRWCVALACVSAAPAQNVTGRWEANYSQIDEGRKVILGLTVQGGKITGYMIQPNSQSPFVDGSISDNQITLVTERAGRGAPGQAAPAPVRTTYTATLESDKLVLQLPAGRGPARTWEFKRVSR